MAWQLDDVLLSQDMIADEQLIRSLSAQYRDIPGDVVEVGVYKGDSLELLAQLWPDRTVWGFDTFAGLPEPTAVDGCGNPAGKFACGLETVQKRFIDCGNVQLIKGLFSETCRVLIGRRFAFVHLDVDLYESYRHAIEFFRNKVDGCMLFDDYGCASTPGAKRAINDSGVILAGKERDRAWVTA